MSSADATVAANAMAIVSRKLRNVMGTPVVTLMSTDAFRPLCQRNLLVTKSLDRVEFGGLGGRIDAEKNAQKRTETESNQDRPQRSVNRRQSHPFAEEGTDEIGEARPSHDSDKAAEAGQDDGLDQKLHEDVLAPGTQRLSQTDLPRSLRHRDEHDVHDADAADDQGDADDPGHAARDAEQDAGNGLHQLLLGRDLEIVLFT